MCSSGPSGGGTVVQWHMQVRLIGDSKLPVGVNVSVSGCLYVGPVTDCRPV